MNDLTNLSDEQLTALYQQKQAKSPSDMSDAELKATYAKQAPDAKPSGPLSWGDVGYGAATNALPSLGNLAVNTVQPFLHPIETAKSIKNIGQGVLEKTGIMSGGEHIPHADAVGQFFADRYGGMENFKKTLATDPAGVAADLATVLSGGSAAAARVPGVIGQGANIVSKVGRAVDPFVQTGNAISGVAKGVGYLGSELIGGLGTHTGGQSLRTAASAGFQGGPAAEAFQGSIRGSLPMEGAVSDARTAVTNLKKERGAVYREGMAGVAADATPLSFDKIDAAIADSNKIKQFKGEDLSPHTAAVRQEMGDAVNKWKALSESDPAFRTAKGIDALKQQIGDIKDAQPYNSPQRAVANQIYGALRETIVNQAPEYANVMKGYEKASDLISEMERTLSLNPKASVDTSLRKLQSIMRNNANTDYGKRLDLGNLLEQHGAPHLMEKLAGQTLNSLTPRGWGKITALPQMAAAYAVNPTLLAATPLMSPRAMGESAYYGGRVAKALTTPARHMPQGSGRAALLAAMNAGRLGP